MTEPIVRLTVATPGEYTALLLLPQLLQCLITVPFRTKVRNNHLI